MRVPLRAAAAAAVALIALMQLPLPTTADSDSGRNYNPTGILDGLLLNYDNRLRPNYGGQPVDVEVSMYVLDISSLSDKNMEYTMDFYLRQFWTDPRLRYAARPGLESISLGAAFGQRIWMPDTFIVNERNSRPRSAHTSDEFVRFNPSGLVVRSVRMSVTASCPMNMQYFPMDQQICALELESYGFTMNDIRYKWKDGSSSLGVSYTTSLPQFHLIGYRAKEMEVRLTSGNYSRMYCEFQFARSLGYHVAHTYIPAALVVVISWASFWLERGTARAGRVALGAGALLAMTALMACTSADLPKVSYLTAYDVYIAFCFLMVVAALLEYALVCYMMKRLQASEERMKNLQKMAEEHNKEVRFETAKGSGGGVNGHHADDPQPPGPPGSVGLGAAAITALHALAPATLDKYARILFPVCFVCFNLIYWVIYLHIGAAPAADLILV